MELVLIPRFIHCLLHLQPLLTDACFTFQPTFGSSSPGGFGTWGQQTPVKQEKYAESGFSGGFNQPPQSASPFSGGGAFAFGSVASTPAPGVNPGSNPFKKQDSGGPRNQALGGRGGRGRGRGPAVTGASNDRYSHTFDGFGDRNIPPDNPFPGGAPASFFAAGGRTGRDSSNSWRDHARGADSGAPLAGRGTGGLTRQYNCRVCQQQFSDRPQLQQHLADSGHYNTPVSTDPQSSQQRFSQSQESLPDGRGGRGRNRGGVDNGGNPQPFVSRPSSGYSSMMQRHIGGQVDNARAHGSGRFGGRGDKFDGRGWGRLNGRQKTDQRPVSPKNLAPTISWRDNTNGSQINSGPDTTYNSAAADAEAMDDPNADESQLEYSEDDDNEVHFKHRFVLLLTHL